MQTRMMPKNLDMDEETLEVRFDGLMENLKRFGVSKKQVREKARELAGADAQDWKEAWTWMLEGDRFLVYQNAGILAHVFLTDEDYILNGEEKMTYTSCSYRKLVKGMYHR